MKEPQQHNDEKHPVGKLLKSLPKMQASPDFEKRLHERIAVEPEQHRLTGWLGTMFVPKRIPVFAYSLVTLILVGVVSYYVFVRSGSVPQSDLQTIREPERSVLSSAPNDSEPLLELKTDHSVKKSPFQDQNITATKDAKAQSNEKPLLNEQRKENRLDESAKISAQQGVEATRQGAAAVMDKGKIEMRERTQPIELQKRQKGSIAVEESASTQEQRTEIAAPSLQKETRSLAAPEVQSAKTFEYRHQMMYNASPSKFDSAALKDSLKADSLRRMQQHKAKHKKPGSQD